MRTTFVSRASILIVDEERRVWKPLPQVFKDADQIHLAVSAAQAFSWLRRHPFHLVFLGVQLPDLNGIELLKILKRSAPHKPVIMASAVRDVQTAVDAMKAGALDFLTTPIDAGHVRTLATQALARLQACIQMKSAPAPMDGAGRDGAMQRLDRIIEALSPIECHALILGGNDLLKNRIARRVHARSARAKGPYTALDCAGKPSRSLEKALFGRCRRDACHAAAGRNGKIEQSHGGSLFLDNVDRLGPDLQSKLLGCIKHQEFKAPGSHRRVKADVRIIAASGHDLQALVEEGLFLHELHAGLNALPIDLPLLQTQGDDIGLLLEHIFNQDTIRNGVRRRCFSDLARSTLMACDWPGNTREFEHLLERLCHVHAGQMPAATEPSAGPEAISHPRFEGLALKKATRAFERQHIIAALKAFGGNRAETARHLGIHRNTLRTKTRELGIDRGVPGMRGHRP